MMGIGSKRSQAVIPNIVRKWDDIFSQCTPTLVSQQRKSRARRPRQSTTASGPRAAFYERSICSWHVTSCSWRIDCGIYLSNRRNFEARRSFGLFGIHVPYVIFAYCRGDSSVLAASVQNVGHKARHIKGELVSLVHAICNGHIRHPYDQRHTFSCRWVLGRCWLEMRCTCHSQFCHSPRIRNARARS